MAAEDPKLAKNLNLARRATKEDALFFAMVMKGGAEGALIVSKRKITPKEIKEAKEKCGGRAVISGRCFGEDGKVVFESGKPPPGTMQKVLKTVINREAGLTLNVLPRLAPEMTDDALAGEDGEGVPEAPPGEETPEEKAANLAADAAEFKTWQKELLVKAQAAPDEVKQKIMLGMTKAQELAGKQQFDQANMILDKLEDLLEQAAAKPGEMDPTQLAALTSAFKRRQKELLGEAVRAPGEVKEKVKLAMTQAEEHVAKREFDQANALLDSLEELLAKGPAAPSGDPAAAEWEQTLAALEPRYQAALQKRAGDVNKMRGVFGYAQDQAAAGQYAKAANALRQLEQLLAAAEQGAGAPEGEKEVPGLVKYRKALLKFHDTVAQVNRKLANFGKTVAGALPDEAETAQEIVEQIAAMQSTLADTIDEAINAAENEREPYTDATRAAIQKHIADIKGNVLIKHIDKNPFVAVDVEATLTGALSDIAANMV
jgi:hypothetical protein